MFGFGKEDNKNKPRVSVVIPSYNRADYIEMTIDSVLNQSFEDFELVFVDDGSTDKTAEIVKDYEKKDSRVRYVKQKNSERAVARSFGISKARADLVCLVDSDDIWYRDKLEKQVAIMDSNPNVVLCYAPVNRIDFHNERLPAAPRQHEGFSGFVFEKLLERNFIPSVTPMIRKETLDKVGKQVTEFIPYEDWDFWLRISKHGDFYHIKEPLGDYRIHPGQSVQNVNPEKIEEVTIKVLDANTKALKEKEVALDKKDQDNNLTDGSSAVSIKNISTDVVDNAYSLAYLRIAYWYILANKAELAREKLEISSNFAKGLKRKLDYKWFGLFASSYMPKQAKSLLASFH